MSWYWAPRGSISSYESKVRNGTECTQCCKVALEKNTVWYVGNRMCWHIFKEIHFLQQTLDKKAVTSRARQGANATKLPESFPHSITHGPGKRIRRRITKKKMVRFIKAIIPGSCSATKACFATYLWHFSPSLCFCSRHALETQISYQIERLDRITACWEGHAERHAWSQTSFARHHGKSIKDTVIAQKENQKIVLKPEMRLVRLSKPRAGLRRSHALKQMH